MAEAPEPSAQWIDEFKRMDIDSMLMELTLLGQGEFADAIGEHLWGPVPEHEKRETERLIRLIHPTT